jgi:predicted DNA-binding protein
MKTLIELKMKKMIIPRSSRSQDEMQERLAALDCLRMLQPNSTNYKLAIRRMAGNPACERPDPTDATADNKQDTTLFQPYKRQPCSRLPRPYPKRSTILPPRLSPECTTRRKRLSLRLSLECTTRQENLTHRNGYSIRGALNYT